MNIPPGWRFYHADASIEGQCSVMLIRSTPHKEAWFNLSEEEQEQTSLYKSATASTFEEAVKLAAEKARKDMYAHSN